MTRLLATSHRARLFMFLTLLVVVGVTVFHPGLNGGYFADDFEFVMDLSQHGPAYYLTHHNPFNNFARPIQAAFLAWVQSRAGMDTWPIHAVQLTLHVGLCSLIAWCMLTVGFSTIQATVASLLMLVSQANAHAVLSNDTLSQILGTALGCVSLLLAYRSASSYAMLAMSGLAFLLALFSKETSICFVLMLPVIFWLSARNRHRISTFRAVVVRMLPYLPAVGCYVWYRSHLHAATVSFGEDRYEFHLGLNVIRNFTQMIAGLLMPVSSVTAYTALHSGGWLVALLVAGAIMGVAGLIVAGIHADGRWGCALVFALFAVLACFPVVLLNHIGELYLYNAMPFVAVLGGMGLGRCCERHAHGYNARTVAVELIVVFLLSHACAVYEKATMMAANGRRTAALLDQLHPYVESAASDAHLMLVNPPAVTVEYSVFQMSGFHVIAASLNRVRYLWHRPDVTLEIIETAALRQAGPKAAALRLTLNNETIVPWSMP